MNTFGDRLREARRASGLTQEALAAHVDVTKSAVSGWENNRETPSFDRLRRLSDALGVGLDELMAFGGHYAKLGGSDSGDRSIGDDGVAVPYMGLAPEEACLVRSFRRLTPKKRRALLALFDCEPPGGD